MFFRSAACGDLVSKEPESNIDYVITVTSIMTRNEVKQESVICPGRWWETVDRLIVEDNLDRGLRIPFHTPNNKFSWKHISGCIVITPQHWIVGRGERFSEIHLVQTFVTDTRPTSIIWRTQLYLMMMALVSCSCKVGLEMLAVKSAKFNMMHVDRLCLYSTIIADYVQLCLINPHRPWSAFFPVLLLSLIITDKIYYL